MHLQGFAGVHRLDPDEEWQRRQCPERVHRKPEALPFRGALEVPREALGHRCGDGEVGVRESSGHARPPHDVKAVVGLERGRRVPFAGIKPCGPYPSGGKEKTCKHRNGHANRCGRRRWQRRAHPWGNVHEVPRSHDVAPLDAGDFIFNRNGHLKHINEISFALVVQPRDRGRSKGIMDGGIQTHWRWVLALSFIQHRLCREEQCVFR
mmetsp:Transcript_42078/g.116233  ORF Transcript_42078/g.116233 Transcript_42078/m.116233 type:complete len:208 (+) Transcript_42078:1147-1770(+)